MKTAVVLFNLGGPDSPQAVRGFLRNLFGDPAILRLPWPIRPLLAAVIVGRLRRGGRKLRIERQQENLLGTPVLDRLRGRRSCRKPKNKLPR
jgi:hypothetical protein